MKKIRIFLGSVGYWRSVRPLFTPVTPPVGFLYIAAYLRSKMKADIMIVDQNLRNISNDDLIKQAIKFKPDIIGLRALTTQALRLPYITESLRTALRDSLIVLGGPHVSAVGAAALVNTSAHVAVPYEGERAFEDVIQAHRNHEGFDGIPGIHWRRASGEIVSNPGMYPYICDLDSLPFPAYDLIDLRQYWKHQSFGLIPRRKYISLYSSRGCPYHCIFCHRIFGERFRSNSAERVVDEIRYFTKKYNIHDVEFIDDIFNFDRKRISLFCDLVSGRNMKIRFAFPNGIRSDILNEDSISALVDAGLYYASFALESGSPRIQKLIGKNLNIPKFLKTVDYAAHRGVLCNGFVMFGFPTSTEEDMKKTVDVTCRSRLHTAAFFTVIPFPNTAIYKIAKRTQPEMLSHLKYDFEDYQMSQINLSAVSDDTLHYYKQKAVKKFYLNPLRMARILRVYPKPYIIPLLIPGIIRMAATRMGAEQVTH